LGQDLSRCQQAYHLNRKHGGRQATLIEGPAGRGKDATLNLVIKSFKQQAEQRQESMPEVFSLNACDCSWKKVCEKIQTAKVHGGIVVISEMNLIDSQHLEGELNDILAGDAHPGFHLFATINPPEYSGRKPLSPALKGRFRHLPIRQYSQAELQAIAGKVLPQTQQGKILAEQLTKQHCRLRAYLQEKKLPLQPTSLDLQNVAKAVLRGGDFTEKGLHQCLSQHYRLYLMAAKRTLEKLPGPSAIAVATGEPDAELCDWFNRTIPGINRPWLIRRSDLNSIDEQSHEICINTHQTEEEIKTEIIKRVVQARWQASGLPLNPNESDDFLIGALYRHWQQGWFNHQFSRTGVEANSVLPMTEEQQQTLTLSANQPYLQEADRRISAWNSNTVQLWPAFWHQLSDLPSHLFDDYIDEERAAKVRKGQAPALDQSTCHEPQSIKEALTTGDGNAPEKYNPEDHEEEAPALDRRTRYEHRGKPQADSYIIFERPGLPSGMYRWWAKDVYVSPEGDVKLIDINDQHMQGAEVLSPARLSGPDQEVTLASDQTLATFDWASDNGRYALPSLTPDDYIVALRMKPDLPYTLIRDRYTGLHTLYVAEAEDNQNIQFAYVVEQRKPREKTSVEEARSEASNRFDARCSEGMKTVLEKLFRRFRHIDELSCEVKQLLETIEKAEDPEQRINAIEHYCQQFSGNAAPEYGANLFHFLVTRRQGSCRHRAPVFVAFCRYFGIPCRQIINRDHAFAECSVDGGQTWKFVDLGGAPVEATEILSKFQPTKRVSGSGGESKRIKKLFKGADSAQQQALAEACGISLEELNTALETGGALPVTDDLSNSGIVRNLWDRKDVTGFATGVSMLESLETDTLSSDEKALVGNVRYGRYYNTRIYKPMSEAVQQILADGDEVQVTELLKPLHSKMIVQGGANPQQWLNSMVDMLSKSDLETPPVIRLADEALTLGWLDPLPTCDDRIENPEEHWQLLWALESIDELKAKATHCLKMWYRKFLSREKNSQVWQLAYENFQKKKNDTFFITHCHDGSSPLLENDIVDPSIQIVWTDEPEGVPNIERMLVHDPAFEQLNSGKMNRRPVIIVGGPDWNARAIKEKHETLFQRKVNTSPDLKQLLENTEVNSFFVSQVRKKLRHRCWQAIQQAFTHYLYDVTLSKGGRLMYCWGHASFRTSSELCSYGSHDPSSRKELYAMMTQINSSYVFEHSRKDACFLKQAQNASNALVLKPYELKKIAREFVNSVNLNSLCDALDNQSLWTDWE
uniref:transglutaminase-like domain-containing protein n=1 Tax=Endozoicomonas sp. SESOKO2 TaxID=2828743 RepID=UPI0021480915